MPEALAHATSARDGFEPLGLKVAGLPGVTPPPAVAQNSAAGALLAPGAPLPRGSASRTYELWLLPVYLDSFLLDGSSKGIVQQALSGVGVTFLSLSDQIIKEVSNTTFISLLFVPGAQDTFFAPSSYFAAITLHCTLLPSLFCCLQYPHFDPGVGYAYLGAFYTVAPWPLGNLKTAQKHMVTLNSISPKSRRNR
jgi:hypothetical protein